MSANGRHGMNWIRPVKRLAIYLRDGLACCYCGDSVENGAKLTLDHVHSRAKGGGNEPSNLLTACHACNSIRSGRSYALFMRQWCALRGWEVVAKIAHHRALLAQPLDMNAARFYMRRRVFSKALRAAAVS